MKKFALIILFLVCTLPAKAQFFSGDEVVNNPNFDMQKWSWGYFLGFNSFDLDFNYKEVLDPPWHKDYVADRTIGFNVGLVGNMRINNNLDLRLEPGVAFNRINFQFLKADQNSFREINQTYVHIPLLLKFSADRIGNFKPFLVGGLSTSINLSSNENNPDDNNDGQFRMTTNSYYWEIGFGVDFYLYYFKFSPSIRGVFAINDQLIRDADLSSGVPSQFTSNVDKMRSRGIFLNFTFQ